MTQGPLVLVVEDEPPMRKLLRATLQSHGYRVVDAASAAEAMTMFTSHNPDLVILDLGLPDVDGIDVTRRLREFSQVPIIVLSARGREWDKVETLDAGANDYVTKPFGTNELLARVRVALRLASIRNAGAADMVVQTGPLTVDLAKRTVSVVGRDVHLTPIEYKMLATMAKHLGKVITHRQLLNEVWGPTYGDQTHYLRVHMAQLRRKIEPDPARPQLLATEPGVGYRLRDEPPVVE
ncbi:MAG: response regulator [Polyangiaceae bacterium]|nr:response regulator [Polyangiaceae bacterium]